MLKLKKVVVTGGLATGKTTVCQIFRELGAYVVSADEIVHQLLASNAAVVQQIVDIFGTSILSRGRIDRKKIAKRVFASKKELSTLEGILHPLVFAEIDRMYEQVKLENRYQLFVSEIPLYFESDCPRTYDAVIAVVSDEHLCKERFLRDKQKTVLDFELRKTHQFDQREKALRANYVLYNNGTPQELRSDVQALFTQLTAGE